MIDSNIKQKVIIYGDSDFAEQVYYQLISDGRYEVCAFTVDENRLEKQEYLGLTLYAFQKLGNYFEKNEIKIFVAIGYSKMNAIREAVINEVIDDGYKLLTYISKHAYINENVIIGDGSYICEFVSIGCNSILGKGSVILPHCSVAHDVKIHDFVFLSHSVIIGGKSEVNKKSFIGLNSTIKNNIIISQDNLVGSGSNIIHSTEPNSIYVGNPARKIGNVDSKEFKFD